MLKLVLVAFVTGAPPSIQWDYNPPWQPLHEPCPSCNTDIIDSPFSSLEPGVPTKLSPEGESTIMKMAVQKFGSQSPSSNDQSVKLVYLPEGRLSSLNEKGLVRMVSSEALPSPKETEISLQRYTSSDKQKRDHRGQTVKSDGRTSSFPMTLVAAQGKEATAKEQLKLLEAALSSPLAKEITDGELPRVFIAPSNIPPPPGYVKIPLVPHKQAMNPRKPLPSTFLTHSNPNPLPPGFVRLTLPENVSQISQEIPLVQSSVLRQRDVRNQNLIESAEREIPSRLSPNVRPAVNFVAHENKSKQIKKNHQKFPGDARGEITSFKSFVVPESNFFNQRPPTFFPGQRPDENIQIRPKDQGQKVLILRDSRDKITEKDQRVRRPTSEAEPEFIRVRGFDGKNTVNFSPPRLFSEPKREENIPHPERFNPLNHFVGIQQQQFSSHTNRPTESTNKINPVKVPKHINDNRNQFNNQHNSQFPPHENGRHHHSREIDQNNVRVNSQEFRNKNVRPNSPELKENKPVQGIRVIPKGEPKGNVPRDFDSNLDTRNFFSNDENINSVKQSKEPINHFNRPFIGTPATKPFRDVKLEGIPAPHDPRFIKMIEDQNKSQNKFSADERGVNSFSVSTNVNQNRVKNNLVGISPHSKSTGVRLSAGVQIQNPNTFDGLKNLSKKPKLHKHDPDHFIFPDEESSTVAPRTTPSSRPKHFFPQSTNFPSTTHRPHFNSPIPVRTIPAQRFPQNTHSQEFFPTERTVQFQNTFPTPISTTREPIRQTTFKPFTQSQQPTGSFRSSTHRPFKSQKPLSQNGRPFVGSSHFTLNNVGFENKFEAPSPSQNNIPKKTIQLPKITPKPVRLHEPFLVNRPRQSIEITTPNVQFDVSRGNKNFIDSGTRKRINSVEIVNTTPEYIPTTKFPLFDGKPEDNFEDDRRNLHLPSPQKVNLDESNFVFQESSTEPILRTTEPSKTITPIRVTTFKPKFRFNVGKPILDSVSEIITSKDISTTENPIKVDDASTLFPSFSEVRKRQRFNKKTETASRGSESGSRKTEPGVFGRRIRPRFRKVGANDKSSVDAKSFNGKSTTEASFKSRLNVSNRVRNRHRGRFRSTTPASSTVVDDTENEDKLTKSKLDSASNKETAITEKSVKENSSVSRNRPNFPRGALKRRPGACRRPNCLRKRRRRLRQRTTTKKPFTENEKPVVADPDPPIRFIDDNSFVGEESARVEVVRPFENIFASEREVTVSSPEQIPTTTIANEATSFIQPENSARSTEELKVFDLAHKSMDKISFSDETETPDSFDIRETDSLTNSDEQETIKQTVTKSQDIPVHYSSDSSDSRDHDLDSVALETNTSKLPEAPRFKRGHGIPNRTFIRALELENTPLDVQYESPNIQPLPKEDTVTTKHVNVATDGNYDEDASKRIFDLNPRAFRSVEDGLRLAQEAQRPVLEYYDESVTTDESIDAFLDETTLENLVEITSESYLEPISTTTENSKLSSTTAMEPMIITASTVYKGEQNSEVSTRTRTDKETKVLGHSTVLEVRSSQPKVCFSNGKCILTGNYKK